MYDTGPQITINGIILKPNDTRIPNRPKYSLPVVVTLSCGLLWLTPATKYLMTAPSMLVTNVDRLLQSIHQRE